MASPREFVCWWTEEQDAQHYEITAHDAAAAARMYLAHALGPDAVRRRRVSVLASDGRDYHRVFEVSTFAVEEPLAPAAMTARSSVAGDEWGGIAESFLAARADVLATAQAKADETGCPVRAVVHVSNDGQVEHLPVGWGLPEGRRWTITIAPDGTESVSERTDSE